MVKSVKFSVPLLSLLLLSFVGCRTSPPAEPSKPQITIDGTSLAVNDSVPPDPSVQAMLAPFTEQVAAEMKQTIATADAALTRDRPEGAMGNLVVDAMRKAAADSTGKPVDVAFTNAGGVRNDLPAGVITLGSVFEVMPFDNTIVVFELSGEALQKTLNSVAGRGGDPVSGLRMRISKGNAVDVVIGGKALDPEGHYRVATNDYVFDGGGRFGGLHEAKRVVRTGVLLRDALVAEIQRRNKRDGSLRPLVDGRMQKRER